MKRFLSIFISLICILGFATNVYAAGPSSITTNITDSDTLEYVDGLEINHNKASSYDLYVLEKNTFFDTRTTLTDPEEADSGFAYIVNNSKVTSSTEKNYYIAQIAILWYQDYLNGNDTNIPASIKTKIANNTSDTVSYYINKLVNGAKSYSENDSAIKIMDNNLTFTRSGNYYYSNTIYVETDNLKTTPSVKFNNAPSSTQAVDNTLKKDGEGSFRIRIPVSSLSNYIDDEFLVEIIGSGYNSTVYQYSKYGATDVIYGRTYSSTSSEQEASIIARIKGFSKTNVKISVLDEKGDYIRNLKYNIYSGNCSNTTCNSNNLVQSFTTKNTYITLTNVLNSGTYTFVNKSNFEYYNLPEKTVINVNDTTYTQEFIIDSDNSYFDDNNYDDNYNTDSQKIITIYNPNSNNDTFKIYDKNNSLVETFVSKSKTYNVSLYPGEYKLVNSKNTIEANFRVTNNGELYVTEGAKEVRRNQINIDYYYIVSIPENEFENNNVTNNNNNNSNNNSNTNNNKDDKTENVYKDEDGTIYIDNFDDIESIKISSNASSKTDVKVEWLSNIIDCPITSLSATTKYVIGAIILGLGTYLVIRNVKKNKNNI